MAKNPGKLVELPDGRIGVVYNKEAQLINGKLPVHTYENTTRADLFNEKSALSGLNKPGKKIMADPKTLKVIGMVD